MKGFILDSDYQIIEDKSYIYLYGKLENNQTFVTINQYKPYFYIKEKDLKKALKIEKFDYEDNEFKNFAGEKVIKIYAKTPQEITKLRLKFKDENLDYYEADIKFIQRFLIDKGKNSSFDIEGEY